jgi:hypothetical protein
VGEVGGGDDRGVDTSRRDESGEVGVDRDLGAELLRGAFAAGRGDVDRRHDSGGDRGGPHVFGDGGALADADNGDAEFALCLTICRHHCLASLRELDLYGAISIMN